MVGDSPACSCLANYIGRPPNCRPECLTSAECPSNLACQNERCVDPCPGSCGRLALCTVVNHGPVCTCPTGYVGDAFVACSPAPVTCKSRTITSTARVWWFGVYRRSSNAANALMIPFFCRQV